MAMCFCGRADLNPEHCDYVVDGRPLCDPDCMKRVRNWRQRDDAVVEILSIVRDARAARDVPVGTSWGFRDHPTMAEVMRREQNTRIEQTADGFRVVG